MSEVVEHADSVAVLALDNERRVLLIHQYRHPVAQMLWELPAGLRDQDGEAPLDTARRELAEDRATCRHVGDAHWPASLAGYQHRDGAGYLATDLQLREGGGDAEGEERNLDPRWLSLERALQGVLTGAITNHLAVAGILAACARARRDLHDNPTGRCRVAINGAPGIRRRRSTSCRRRGPDD